MSFCLALSVIAWTSVFGRVFNDAAMCLWAVFWSVYEDANKHSRGHDFRTTVFEPMLCGHGWVFASCVKEPLGTCSRKIIHILCPCQSHAGTCAWVLGMEQELSPCQHAAWTAAWGSSLWNCMEQQCSNCLQIVTNDLSLHVQEPASWHWHLEASTRSQLHNMFFRSEMNSLVHVALLGLIRQAFPL